ncbi:MAG TPA: hypothetical protein VM032_01220 [Vicinamibacterales bacterium]|nr:hypothetical protein [Vicinamibacterales bacterium]
MSMDLDNIKRFVAAWYLALDNHAPTEELTALLTDDVQMIFPEKTLPGLSDFKAWYAGGKYSDGTDAPGVINIFFDENHNVVSVEKVGGTEAEPDLKVVVAWQAGWFIPPSTKARRTSLDATQAWTIRASNKNRFGVAICKYNAMAAPFAYAPGFARL